MFGSPWTALPLKMGPIGCPETSVTINLRRVTSQKGEYLIYTAAHACFDVIGLNWLRKTYISDMVVDALARIRTGHL
jgi:hypothetical protein